MPPLRADATSFIPGSPISLPDRSVNSPSEAGSGSHTELGSSSRTETDIDQRWTRWVRTVDVVPPAEWPYDQPDRLDETPGEKRIREGHFGGKPSEDPTDTIYEPPGGYPSLSMKHPYVSVDGGSDSGLSSDTVPSDDDELSEAAEEKLITETMEIMPDFHARYPRLKKGPHYLHSIAVKKLTKDGRHLAALRLALEGAYKWTFVTDPSPVFSASIAVYRLGRNDKDIPVIDLKFHKNLHFPFRKFLARRLFNSVLTRYPKGYFPRIFGVVEEVGKQKVVLHAYSAYDDSEQRCEKCSACRHSIIVDWKAEREGSAAVNMNGGSAVVNANESSGGNLVVDDSERKKTG